MESRGQAHNQADNADDDVRERAVKLRTFAMHRSTAHYIISHNFERRNQLLGVPIIGLSAVVSTAIFSSLAAQNATAWKVVTGLVSVAVAVLAALQSFFKYAERAAQHQTAARGYSIIRRRLDLFVLEWSAKQFDLDTVLSELGNISEELGKLEGEEPPIIDRVYERVKKKYLPDAM